MLRRSIQIRTHIIRVDRHSGSYSSFLNRLIRRLVDLCKQLIPYYKYPLLNVIIYWFCEMNPNHGLKTDDIYMVVKLSRVGLGCWTIDFVSLYDLYRYIDYLLNGYNHHILDTSFIICYICSFY